MNTTGPLGRIWSAIARFLNPVGPAPTVSGQTGNTAVEIWRAIEAGDVDTVTVLLDANPNVTPFSRGTWLHHAAREGKLDIVKLLVARGLDVNARDGQGEQTPLARAATAGEIDVVRYLLDHGAVMETGASVSNPMFACISGYGGVRDEPRERFVPVAKLLIERGVDLTACYVQESMVDMDAAAFAYMWGREDIAELILEALYCQDEHLLASAWAETIEVALGNAYSRQKFRKWRYPPKRGKNAGQTPPPGEF